ncbi:MAG: metal-dependent transcriptional regulator [Erysipelothrix sp.]|nr:metal-dependent transcriptional regulator [Erysipelothrix sp.]
MTKNREDYIKRIFQFEEENIPVSNKLLADTLEIAPASVSQMIAKLVESNLVTYENGQVKLLDAAIIIAKQLVSKHRLWEAFLLKNLNYSWAEVHDDAELLEHATSPFLMEKLNEFLNYPTHCPHGGRIYVNTLDYSDNLSPLSDLSVGSLGQIKRLSENSDFLRELKDLNLNIEDQIEVIKVNDLISITSKEKEITLSKHLAKQIYIEVI